jgi:predicted lipid-binding transport protein (Tim44 family)
MSGKEGPMDGIQFIDIVFFAMIAAFLVLRLRSVLGRRDHTETGHVDPFARDAQAAKRAAKTPPERPVNDASVVRLPHPDSEAAGEQVQGLRAIAAADAAFDPDEFVQGARLAFEMILAAYVQGDKTALAPLLSSEVMAQFSSAIDERAKTGEQLEQKLVGIRSASIVEAYLDGRVANVLVRFVSDQINAVRDAAGAVVDGDPAAVVEVVDVWTFARDTSKRDPNWLLVGTQTPE